MLEQTEQVHSLTTGGQLENANEFGVGSKLDVIQDGKGTRDELLEKMEQMHSLTVGNIRSKTRTEGSKIQEKPR